MNGMPTRELVATPNIPTHVLRFFLSRNCGVLYVFNYQRKENGKEKMNFDNDEEALGLLNRLLEGLHQAGFENFGSHINLVYVAPGAQHVETQINMGAYPQPLPKGREKKTGNLPEVLATEEAMALWKKAQAAGYVDDNYQPLISRTQSALLADAMAERLGIREKWKVFGDLWLRTKMYKDYYQALEQKQSLVFQDKLKLLFD